MPQLLTTLTALLSLTSLTTAQYQDRKRHADHRPKPTSCRPPGVTPILDPNGFPPGHTFNPTLTTKGLGGPIRPTTATQTFAPLDWSTVIIPEIRAFPIDASSSSPSNSSFSNSTIAKRAAGLAEHSDPPLQVHLPIHKRANPTSIDWRNRWGWPWLASIQDQKGCNSCWAMAATALIESMMRIERGFWSKRSEGDLHDQIGGSCATLGDPNYALDWAFDKGGGVSDPQCYEYLGGERMYFPCGDRAGRAVRLGQRYTLVTTVEDQKTWLNNIGPLSACFTFYPDFFGWNFTGTDPYKWDGVTNATGGHCVLIVGYDDNVGGWLFRNSWGVGFGNRGYGYFK